MICQICKKPVKRMAKGQPEGETVVHLGCGLMRAMQRQNKNTRRRKLRAALATQETT
jgi:hypothetical protein